MNVLYMAVKDAVVLPVDRNTRTQQHFKEEVDINTIVRRFGVTGQMPEFTPEGVYGDFSGVDGYDAAVAKIAQADEAFMKLPPEVRERFGNSAAELIRAASLTSEDEFGKLVFPVKADGNAVIPPKDEGGGVGGTGGAPS